MFRLVSYRRRFLFIPWTTLSKRTISVTPCVSKRVTRGNMDDVFGKAEPITAPILTTTATKTNHADASKKTPRKKSSQKNENESKVENKVNLEPKSESTGSVVLDTVRKYTEKHPDCVLLVQVGDFYELYESHATHYASELDLKLTRKEMTTGITVDFAGFPSRALDRYLDILVNRLGCRVALCEQYTPVKREGDDSIIGIKRHITRVITPGTVIEERFLDSHAYNYLLAILPDTSLSSSSPITTTASADKLGLAWIDISIGEFMIQSSKLNELKDDIARIRPREIILPESFKTLIEEQDSHLEQNNFSHSMTRILSSHPGISITYMPQDHFNSDAGRQKMETLFSTENIATTTTKDDEDMVLNKHELAASSALLDYIHDTHPHGKPRLLKPIRVRVDETLQIDSATVSSLELVKSLREGGKTNSLLSCINYTVTNAGSRQLAQWLLAPSSSIHIIQQRHDIVDFLVADHNFILDDVRAILRESADAQRAMQRLALGRGQHLDLLEIWSTLNVIKMTKELLKGNLISSFARQLSSASPTVKKAMEDLINRLDPHQPLADYIGSVIDHERIMSDDAKEYSFGFIRSDFDPQLHHLHQKINGLYQKRDYLQESLRSIGGTSVILLANNSLYKHVVEINATQSNKLLLQYPQATLVQKTKLKHRYQLPEWTHLSIDIQNTHANINELENKIWDKTVERVLMDSTSIIAASALLAQLDVFCSFAWMARRYKYVRPTMTQIDNSIKEEQGNGCDPMHIYGGRHPVVEANLAQKGRAFVKNDCILGGNDLRSWLLTGPNMGGKSTFLRQNAIIMILAHMGSFVPAQEATIGVADRIMSRIGTADDLAQDLSTFMVEMIETANILKYATQRSLVIMDEVGRGTATTDGISLAYAILSYLHTRTKPRLLFATHYHELSDMVQQKQSLSTIQLYKTDLAEDSRGNFVFLHKIQPGVCRQSHGLKVAQLAGLPSEVITTAKDVWEAFNHSTKETNK
ncbi:DNA mismatch repair protein MutS [Phascolomyces articulosus]|uniref:DNA mismatch repair protein MutS n=1 Tax=Phascolomyces articulosus TaxID=60185 RepID=A0AAD5KCV3_9FUNG|nr:DNA mismatch repair protein MutS [Phascolomyces articulosus]